MTQEILGVDESWFMGFHTLCKLRFQFVGIGLQFVCDNHLLVHELKEDLAADFC